MTDGKTYQHRKYVFEVLEMHLAIKRAKDKGKKFPASHSFVGDFIGFDGNNEGEMLAFANDLLEAVEVYAPIRNPIKAVPDSHSSATWRYEVMLETWEESADPENLTNDDLKRIAERVEGEREPSMQRPVGDNLDN